MPVGLDAQELYNKFIEIYMKHYDEAYPLNSKRIRRKHERVNPKPWVLPWLEEACDRKNKLFHDWIKTPSLTNERQYKNEPISFKKC